MNTRNAASPVFDIDANALVMDRTVLLSTFGEEIGMRLYGASVKLAARYGIELDDVVEEIALGAMEVVADFGFCHVNTAVNKAKSALVRTNHYGVSEYRASRGMAEVSIDAEPSDGDESGDDWAAAFADEAFDWDAIDTALSVRKAVAEIEDDTDRRIAEFLAEGLGAVEIQNEMKLHYSAVIRRRDRRLSKALSGIL